MTRRYFRQIAGRPVQVEHRDDQPRLDGVMLFWRFLCGFAVLLGLALAAALVYRVLP